MPIGTKKIDRKVDNSIKGIITEKIAVACPDGNE